jgi:polar amino acid transport system substrate-binding protein
MKRVFAFFLTMALLFSAAAAFADGSDMAYVKEKGKLVVGITNFAPMDYKDEKGNWIGFDADMASAFAKSLGVSVEFQEIDWDNKILELNGKNIDCVWNGMTLTAEVKAAMECSRPYCNNAQVVVLPKAKAGEYKDAASLAGLTFAVENGSAGMEQAQAHGLKFTPVQDQASALLEVSAGSADAAVIDSLMAAAMVGEGTGYPSLTYTLGLNSEEYGVGFRKGSDLAAALDDFFAAKDADGSLLKTAETYKIQAALIKR